MAKAQKTPLQELFDRVLKTGRKLKNREYDGERERDGSYISGFQNYTTLALLELPVFKVEAIELEWRTYSPAADRNGTRFSLRVLKGEVPVFIATREGASTVQSFGAEERYIGTENAPAQEWKVLRGRLPKGLQTVSV